MTKQYILYKKYSQSDWIMASEHAQTRIFATFSHAHFREHDLSPRGFFHSRFTLECGNVEKKAMFCWPCLLFCPGTSSSWTKTGFKNMKGFLSDCKKHEKAKLHMSAYRHGRPMALDLVWTLSFHKLDMMKYSVIMKR